MMANLVSFDWSLPTHTAAPATTQHISEATKSPDNALQWKKGEPKAPAWPRSRS